jgi:hypothetical protein
MRAPRVPQILSPHPEVNTQGDYPHAHPDLQQQWERRRALVGRRTGGFVLSQLQPIIRERTAQAAYPSGWVDILKEYPGTKEEPARLVQI